MAEADEGRSLILVGVDGTPSSLRAGAYAAGLARGRNARIVCLYVHTPPVIATPTAAAGLETADRDFKDSVASEIRELLAERTRHLGVQAEFIERSGNAFNEIRRAATDLHADTIVVGASEKVGHRVVGAIGSRLIRSGTWPVTVVP